MINIILFFLYNYCKNINLMKKNDILNKTFDQREGKIKISSSNKNEKDNKLIKNKDKFNKLNLLKNHDKNNLNANNNNNKCNKKCHACKNQIRSNNFLEKDLKKMHSTVNLLEMNDTKKKEKLNDKEKIKSKKIKGNQLITNDEINIKKEKIVEPVEIEFNFNDVKVIIQSNIEEKMEDIINSYIQKENLTKDNKFFMYNGAIVDEKLELNRIINNIDRERKFLNILVNETMENNQNEEIISKDFVCPECYENILITFGDYKLNYTCKNNHCKKQFALKNFDELMKINLKKIVCGECKEKTKYSSYQNEFYFCLDCKLNLCPLCKSSHLKGHKIVNYNDRNYICDIHNEKFNKYCVTCNKNVCFYCEMEHKEHNNLINLQSMIIDKDKLKSEMDETGKMIDLIKKYINEIKHKLDETLKNIEIFYNTNKIFVENYDIMKRNYQILKNLNEIKCYNDFLIGNLKYLKVDESLSNKINFIIDIYNTINSNNEEIIYPNGDKYIGEYKNKMRNGKGKMYYNEKDENGRVMYDGYWKDDLFDGKGIMKWKNNDRYNGEWKNGLKEGKGTYYYENGDIYEGEFKNNNKDGKGIYFYKNLNRYEGEMKNNAFEGNGIFYFNNGNKYVGEFKNFKAEGKGAIFHKNGEIEMGNFIGGQFHGKYALLDLNNKISIKKH